MAKNYSNANNSDKNAQSKNGAFSSYSESQNSSKIAIRTQQKMQAEMQVKTQTKMQIKTAQSLL